MIIEWNKEFTAVGGIRPRRVPWGQGLPDRYSTAPVSKGSMYMDWHPCSSGYACNQSNKTHICLENSHT